MEQLERVGGVGGVGWGGMWGWGRKKLYYALNTRRIIPLVKMSARIYETNTHLNKT